MRVSDIARLCESLAVDDNAVVVKATRTRPRAIHLFDATSSRICELEALLLRPRSGAAVCSPYGNRG